MKVLTEISTEISLYINEERTEDEFVEYLQKLISKNIDAPDFTDVTLSQYRGNTYFVRVIRYETNSEQDLTLFIDAPLATGVFRGLLYGFTPGDALFIEGEIVPEALKDVLLRKLIIVGSDRITLEVKGVSPSLITEGANTFTYRESSDGESYLYWYNQPSAQIGCLSFSKENEVFMSGYVSLGLTTNLPRANFPALYDWVEKNTDNILTVDKDRQLIIFPEAEGSYLQIRDSNFSLNKGSETIPKDTTSVLSNYYAASDQVELVKIKQDVNGDSITYMSPSSIPREENILLTKGLQKVTRFENSRGINILIKAI